MSTDFSRRSVLKMIGAGAVAAGAGAALSACGGSGGGGGSVGNAGKKLAPWPTYTPFNGPKPDLPGTAQGVQAGYTAYPQNLVQSVAEKPGDRSVVKAVVLTYGPPPKPASANKFWQAVNDALGVDLQITFVPDAEYTAKMATIMAGGDLPDIICIGGGHLLPNEAQFVVAKCADLTPHLSGDAAKDYPNLANIPTYAWSNVGRFQGKIYGIPVERPLPGQGLACNRDKFEKAGIWSDTVGGLSAADFTKGLTELSGNGKWAMGAANAGGFGFNTIMAGHGAPNEFKAEGGAFTSYLATDEWKAALDQMAQWWKAGVYYADALAIAPGDMGQGFISGTVASFSTSPVGVKNAAIAIKDGFTVDVARPFKPANGAQPANWLGGGFFGYTVLKQAAPDRIKLLLRVLNFLAAPFGSKEWEVVNYGVEGTHYTRDGDGGIKQTKLSETSENIVSLAINFIAAGPQVIYWPGQAEAAERHHAWQQQVIPLGVRNPRFGLRSATYGTQGAELQKFIEDSINSVVTGKSTVKDWDSVVAQWNGKGGAKILQEFAAEHAATQ